MSKRQEIQKNRNYGKQFNYKNVDNSGSVSGDPGSYCQFSDGHVIESDCAWDYDYLINHGLFWCSFQELNDIQPGYFKGQKESPPSIDDKLGREQLVNDEKVIQEMDEEEEDGDKGQLKNNPNDNQPIANQQQPKQKKTDIQPSQLIKNCQIIDKPSQVKQKLQQQLLNPNHPKSLHIQKLPQANRDQIQFTVKQTTKQISPRYCQICKTFQPNRVRHCHQCQKCICTFDHHCPWMNNCIGEKNRNFFWTYLLLQFVQFLLVLIDVGQKAFIVQLNKGRVYFFAAAMLIVTVVSFFLLAFHTYLMVKNLTTWEYVRWDKINYLSIYLYKRSSPFSYGLLRNITEYFVSGNSPKQWVVNPQFLKLNKQLSDKIKQDQSYKSVPQKPKLKSKITQMPQTERAIISRNAY